jgi:hypothetical protein
MKPIDMLLNGVEWESVEPPETPGDLPYITHRGILRICGVDLPCAVLSTGQRVFYGDEIEAMIESVVELQQ